MKITATSKFDDKTIRTFIYVNLFRTGKPEKKVLFYCLISLVLTVMLWMQIYLLGPSVGTIVMLVVALAMLLIELYLYFVYPRLRIKSVGQMRNCVNEFTFLEDKMHIQSQYEGYTGESTVDYKRLHRAVETPDYLYLFHTKGHAMIVDKKTLQGGTAEQLRAGLVGFLNGHYKIYKK